MINVGEDAKNVKPFCTVNGNIKTAEIMEKEIV